MMPSRKKVACGSAATQWTCSPNAAFKPLSLGNAAFISVSTSQDSGSVLLSAQNPATSMRKATQRSRGAIRVLCHQGNANEPG
eukprot:3676949-Prymnesium_polylepis.1